MWFKLMERLEALMELGGTKKDIVRRARLTRMHGER